MEICSKSRLHSRRNNKRTAAKQPSFIESKQYTHIKSAAATGTRRRMLSTPMGQAKHRPAIRAFAVYRCTALPQASPLQTEKSLDRIPHLQKHSVLRLSAGDVPGHHTEQHINKAQPRHSGHCRGSRKEADQPQGNPQNIQSAIQCIHPVASVHKRHQFILPVSHSTTCFRYM